MAEICSLSRVYGSLVTNQVQADSHKMADSGNPVQVLHHYSHVENHPLLGTSSADDLDGCSDSQILDQDHYSQHLSASMVAYHTQAHRDQTRC